MKGCLFIIYKQEHLYRSEEIIKYSMFQWILFVIHKLMSSSHLLYNDDDL